MASRIIASKLLLWTSAVTIPVAALSLNFRSALTHGEDEKTTKDEESSYIDIGFGDDQGSFVGMHRFELLHAKDAASVAKDGVTICSPICR